MLLHTVIFVSLLCLTSTKSILSWNLTTTAADENTLIISTEPTPTETTTESSTITVEYTEKLSTTTATMKPMAQNKSYEFQSNFTRNNDSVFVSLHVNMSDTFVSINNTFTSSTVDNYPCEILVNEYTDNLNQNIRTKIIIDFNRSLTQDLATQLGDRLTDIVDLLSTIQLMAKQNTTVENDL